ncbi:hypothetical protein F4813DRAFT_387104 [Daldinia decipiens]|uniref:uncharacterized protein n=1 Tax=Daldinia decipiens TaxID=326647 RepID=UPI0020C56DF7|nr:uncharacterized protein F4813DRAFT_387104 [Daldinia decipiens]KAI1660239.1 hypothetical protein F4813DRAFT_387104 [Daldinia decipiens]
MVYPAATENVDSILNGTLHPRFRHRSLSTPTYNHHDSSECNADMVEEFNRLKSFQHAWKNGITAANDLPKPNAYKIKAAQAHKEHIPVRSLKLDLIITGNPGTGKSTIARIYAGNLRYLDVKDDVLIVTGSRETIQTLLSHPKARGRFSRRIDLQDYSENDLLAILINILKEDRQKVEGGYNAPFLRMFIQQIGYRKRQGTFQNINTIREEVLKVRQRQGELLEKATWQDKNAVVSIRHESYNLTESDFLRSNPTGFYGRSDAWKKLEKMAGMEKVKAAVEELVSRQEINYVREKEGKELLKPSLNYVFLGPPGTGKTTVATLFGQIIADLGYVGTNKVVVKKPTDFLGQYVGHSEAQTQDILNDTQDKTLIIDEAHMFYHSSERFPLEDEFEFENYDDEALGQILDIMLAQSDVTTSESAKVVAMEVLRRERDRPNFDNGGAVRNLVSRALTTHSKRVSSQARNQDLNGEAIPDKDKRGHIILEPQDFDPEYNRGLQVNSGCNSLFRGLVGFHSIIGVFEGYQKMAANMRKCGLDPRDEIPFSYVFKGPPGTGKTTTARLLGQIYYSMGFLSTTEVVGPNKEITRKLGGLLKRLSETEGWANARDVETLSKRIVRNAFMKDVKIGESVMITLKEVVAIITEVLEERISQSLRDE